MEILRTGEGARGEAVADRPRRGARLGGWHRHVRARHYDRTGLRMPAPAGGGRRYETTAALVVQSRIREELAGRIVAGR